MAKWLLFLGAAVVSLAICTAVLTLRLLHGSQGQSAQHQALSDPEVREEAIRRVMKDVQTGGVNDSHPDQSVQRVLLPSLDTTDTPGQHLQTNAFGMREGGIALPKPPGRFRVVFLGDSYVYGWGVEVEERVGAVLQRLLEEHAPNLPKVECLHLGIASWNIENECAYLRRQLSLLQPDLVVQVIVSNDFGDSRASRGNGLMARYDARHSTGILLIAHPNDLGFSGVSLVHQGLHENSARRMRECGRWIAQLRDAVVDCGGRYLLLAHVSDCKAAVLRFVTSGLGENEFLFTPNELSFDRGFHVSEDDEHWGPSGHGRVAEVLYGLSNRRGLFGDRQLPEWPEAEAMAEKFLSTGLEEAKNQTLDFRVSKIGSVVDFAELDREMACQVDGGIFKGGSVAPYAVLGLRREGQTSLHLVGRRLGRPELKGGTLSVVAEGETIGTIDLHAEDLDVDLQLPLPPPSEYPVLSLELISDDYCYLKPPFRDCISFELHRVELE